MRSPRLSTVIRKGGRNFVPLLISGAAILVLAHASLAQTCPADCNANGAVAINELVACVAVALGASNPCTACDLNRDGSVTINELIAAVNAALRSCPPTPTPTLTGVAATATATPSSSATAVPTASATPTVTTTPPVTPPASPTATRFDTATAEPSITATPTATVPPPTGTLTATATRSSTPEPSQTSTATPTRTATAPVPTQACPSTPLPGESDVSIAGSTVGAGDDLGGASCGFGGGIGAADAAYEYVAPAAGMYDIGTRDATFAVYLYVRDQSCAADEAELACADSAGASDAAVAVPLAAGQRVAIVVDGSGSATGSFTLRVRRRQPDLVVQTITAPAQGRAGDFVQAAAEVANNGDEAAGPFTVELFFARDDSLAEPVSLAPLVCGIAALAPGATSTCAPLNPLTVPLVIADAYVLGARVDPANAIDERDETNNTGAQPFTIAVAPGTLLDQRVLRAADGTIYQLLSASPVLNHTAAGGFQMTTLGAAAMDVESCVLSPGSQGAAARAAVEVVSLAAGAVRRTRLLRPISFGDPLFDAAGSGRLALGGDAGAPVVCADGSCAGESLVNVTASGGEVPPGCFGIRAEGFCGEDQAAAAVGFGIDASNGECGDPSRITTETQICNGAPPDGFRLRAGEAVVFVHAPGREGFTLGAGGFGLAKDAMNGPGCGPNQVVTAETRVENVSRVPLLRLIQQDSQGVLSAFAVSPDGRHVYVAGSGGALVALARDSESGALVQVDEERDGEAGTRGLLGAVAVLVSDDGAHVYVVGLFATVVFRRDPASGALGFVQVVQSTLAFSRGGDISPDGTALYVAARSLFALRRDAASGTLQVLQETSGNFNGSPVVSPDAVHVYAFTSETLVTYAREAGGELAEVRSAPPVFSVGGTQFVVGAIAFSGDATRAYGLASDAVVVLRRATPGGELFADGAAQGGVPGGIAGLVGAVDVATTADGDHVYVASPTAAAITALRRTPSGDGLALIEAEQSDDFAGITALAVSRADAGLYALLPARNAVAALARDPDTGALSPNGLTSVSAGIDLPGCTARVVAADGAAVYCLGGSRLHVFRRDPSNGRLVRIDTVFDGLGGAAGLAVSPDSRHAYVAASVDDAVAVFERDATNGTLSLVEIQRDGVAGIDGLDGAAAIAVGPGGGHVYAAGEAVVVFARDPASGALQSQQVIRDGIDGVQGIQQPTAIVLSPDGGQVYVAGQDLVVFQRDADTGALTFAGVAPSSAPGMPPGQRPDSLAASADGRHVYAVSRNDNSDNQLRIYGRDAQTGALSYLGAAPFAGLIGPRRIALSPDGTLVYLGAEFSLAVFARDAESGALSYVEDPAGLRFGGPYEAAVSPDSRHVYLGNPSYLAVYERVE
jgi:6-phosphogluconolactonase (cycloisomerase 2 family)